jgi:hypothetical protein
MVDPAEAPHEEDDALFDEREAHPDASDVTVIIDGDGLAETEETSTLRPLTGRTA